MQWNEALERTWTTCKKIIIGLEQMKLYEHSTTGWFVQESLVASQSTSLNVGHSVDSIETSGLWGDY
jgi:hypothetical protein